MKNFQQTF